MTPLISGPCTSDNLRSYLSGLWDAITRLGLLLSDARGGALSGGLGLTDVTLRRKRALGAL